MKREEKAAMEKRRAEYVVKYEKYAKLAQAAAGKLSPEEQLELEKKQKERQAKDQKEVFMFAGLLIVGVCVLCVIVTFGMLRLTDWMEARNREYDAASF